MGAIPDVAVSSTKKPPINRWEHPYLGEERISRDAVVSRLRSGNINMRGILTFDLSGYRSSLLRQTTVAAEGRASS